MALQNLCSICKKPLNTGRLEDVDCGGDCLQCMGTAGDPIAAELFLKEIWKLRVQLQQEQRSYDRRLTEAYEAARESMRVRSVLADRGSFTEALQLLRVEQHTDGTVVWVVGPTTTTPKEK